METSAPSGTSAAGRDRLAGFLFERRELAGSFGDLGTLGPFLLSYIALVGIVVVGAAFLLGQATLGIVRRGWQRL